MTLSRIDVVKSQYFFNTLRAWLVGSAVYHDVLGFIARVLTNLSIAGQIDVLSSIDGMMIVACQTHSEPNNDTVIGCVS